ncbi:hypothetical protein D3C78_1298800 [compost metagenome]
MRLEDPERTGVDFGEQPKLRQVTADQRKVVFVVQLSQATYAFYGIFVADLAANGVGRVGGIDHHTAIADDFDGLLDQAHLWVFRMNLEKLTHIFYLFRRRQY